MLATIFFVALLSLSGGVPDRSFETVARGADQDRQSGQLAEALNLYSEAVHLRPSWAEGWWWQGSILYEQDRFSEAEAPFRRFIALSKEPAPAYAFLALCEYETRDYAKAAEHLYAWSRAGSPGRRALGDVAAYHKALLLTRAGRFDEALYLLQEEARKLGNSPALTEAMGLASLRMPFLPEDYPPQRRESVWLAGMAAFFSPQDFQHADTFAQRLLLDFGQEPNVHYFRGTLLHFHGSLDAAIKEFQQELRISPNHKAALTELAVCRIDADQPAEAMAPAKAAVELDPRNARAHYALGRALLDSGSYAESARQLELARELAPDSSRVRIALSNAYRRLGRDADAKREQAAFVALKDKEKVPDAQGEKLTPPVAKGMQE